MTAHSEPDSIVARLEEIVVSRSDGDALWVKITLSVSATAVLFLVGPAGSGKSAILDLLSFNALPKRGHLEVFGVDPARLSPSERPRLRRRVGVMFQDQLLLSELDVFGNVALPARLVGRRPREFAPDISELLVWVGLGGRGADAISKLTEGEKRRLCLARAMINRPDLLVADEPTAGLGLKAGRLILRLIADVNAAGTPVVLATRDRALAETIKGAVYEIPACGAAPSA